MKQPNLSLEPLVFAKDRPTGDFATEARDEGDRCIGIQVPSKLANISKLLFIKSATTKKSTTITSSQKLSRSARGWCN
jgi:hypothetical protein